MYMLSDHRPILLRDVITDYGATLFRFYHSWLDHKRKQLGCVNEIKSKLCVIDKNFDQGGVNDELLLSRKDLMKQMQDIKSSEARDCIQKAKIQ
ncbi:hypothetical protein Tco_0700519 [Tanacetum coccineum]